MRKFVEMCEELASFFKLPRFCARFIYLLVKCIHSFEVVEIAFHILDLLLVLRQVSLEALVFLRERLIVSTGLDFAGRGLVRRHGRLVKASAHTLVIIDVLLEA